MTSAEAAALRSQTVILERGRGHYPKFLPHAFTEHGAIMAATFLNSPCAVGMSICVVGAFVQLREILASNKELARRLDLLEARIGKKLSTHDEAIAAMLSAIRSLMSPPTPKRRGIGFTADLAEQKQGGTGAFRGNAGAQWAESLSYTPSRLPTPKPILNIHTHAPRLIEPAVDIHTEVLTLGGCRPVLSEAPAGAERGG